VEEEVFFWGGCVLGEDLGRGADGGGEAVVLGGSFGFGALLGVVGEGCAAEGRFEFGLAWRHPFFCGCCLFHRILGATSREGPVLSAGVDAGDVVRVLLDFDDSFRFSVLKMCSDFRRFVEIHEVEFVRPFKSQVLTPLRFQISPL